VVPTGRGGEVVEPLDLFRAQLDTVCGAVLLHPCGSLGPATAGEAAAFRTLDHEAVSTG
jgi:hypothetical protein